MESILHRPEIILGQIIKHRRKELGISQQGLSDSSGVSQEGISKIERGAASPRFVTVLSLCESLGLDLIKTIPG